MTKVHDDKDCPGKKLTCTLCARQFAFEYKLRYILWLKPKYFVFEYLVLPLNICKQNL